MKIEMSMKKVCLLCDAVVTLQYASAPFLFHDEEPAYYNAGRRGWNNNTYVLYARQRCIAITTGYRNTRGPKIPAEIVEQYEQRAEAARVEYWRGTGPEARINLRNELDAILHEFGCAVLDWIEARNAA